LAVPLITIGLNVQAAGIEESSRVITESGQKLQEILIQFGFPQISRTNFLDCKKIKNKNKKIKSFKVCSAGPLDNCPYTINGTCMVTSDFVDGAIEMVSFDYKLVDQLTIVQLDILKANLNGAYGTAQLVNRYSPELGLRTWDANWPNQTIKVRMLRLEGTNFYGNKFNTISVIFVNSLIPIPEW
jgi:hypothetical protein